jgi:hypothetical protein
MNEINSLTIESCYELLISRLGENASQEELQNELDIYKQELVEELHRVDNLKARFETMSDKGIIQAGGISNPDAYFRDNILPASPSEAETLLSNIEQHYNSYLSTVQQEATNVQARAFLAATDYKVLRHIRQKALNQALTLSEEEYLALEQERAEAANSIVE